MRRRRRIGDEALELVAVRAAAESSGRDVVVSAGLDRTLRIWDIRRWAESYVLDTLEPLSGLAIRDARAFFGTGPEICSVELLTS